MEAEGPGPIKMAVGTNYFLIPSGEFDAAFETVLLDAWPCELIGFSAVAVRLSESWSAKSLDHRRKWTQLLIATFHHNVTWAKQINRTCIIS